MLLTHLILFQFFSGASDITSFSDTENWTRIKTDKVVDLELWTPVSVQI